MVEDEEKKKWQKRGAGHRARLRERYLERGLDSFTDVEVIELLLSFGTPRSDCKQQAKGLLAEFGSFAKVMEAPQAALQKIRGVGPKNSFAINFIHDVSARYLKVRLEGKNYLHSSKDVIKYLSYQLRGLKREVFIVVFLDSSHAIVSSEILAEGSLNINNIYPRELIVRALEYHAAAIVVAHNHPSGSVKPSRQDINLTNNLFMLCRSMGIQLLDHIIIGDEAYSFADEGLITRAKEASSRAIKELQE